MDPILRIIKYLFEKRNFECNDYTLNSFFSSGTSFPQFIEIIFSEKIPGIIKNPGNSEQKTSNNDKALKFLYKKNKEIAKFSNGYKTKDDKTHLLSLILTKQCFKINEKQIMKECNIIIQPLGKNFKNTTNLKSIKCILYLLNVLTEDKVKIDTKSMDSNKKFNQILSDINQNTDVPIIISKSSLEHHKDFSFLIQILIIFDFFSEKISQIKNNLEATNEQIFEEEEEEENLNLKKRILPKKLLSRDSDSDILEENEEEQEEKQPKQTNNKSKSDLKQKAKAPNDSDSENKNDDEPSDNPMKLGKNKKTTKSKSKFRPRLTACVESENPSDNKKKISLNKNNGDDDDEESEQENIKQKSNQKSNKNRKTEKPLNKKSLRKNIVIRNLDSDKSEEDEEEESEQENNKQKPNQESNKNRKTAKPLNKKSLRKNIVIRNLDSDKSEEEDDDEEEEPSRNHKNKNILNKKSQLKSKYVDSDESDSIKNEEEDDENETNETNTDSDSNDEDSNLDQNYEKYKIFSSDSNAENNDEEEMIRFVDDDDGQVDDEDSEEQQPKEEIKKEEEEEEEEQQQQQEKLFPELQNFDDIHNDELIEKEEIEDSINKEDLDLGEENQEELQGNEDDIYVEDNQEEQQEQQEEEEEEEEEEANDDYSNFLNITTIQVLGDKKEELNEEAIINTINYIGKGIINFDDIIDAIEIENIISFLQILFKEKKDQEFFEELKNDEIKDLKKMNKIINFLGKKKSVFTVLQFNFDSKILARPSAILLYTKILDLFFLKQTKEDLFDRCKTILFSRIEKEDTLYEIKNKKQKKEILLDWNTYLALVYFVNESKIHFNKSKLSSKDYSFEKNQIPKIIDENYLKEIEAALSPVYYQLQFIFDELDKQGFVHNLVESYLRSIRKLNQVKVPKYHTIAESMKPKKVSITEHPIKNNEEEEEDELNKKVGNKIKQEFFGFEKVEHKSPTFVTPKKKIDKIETFKDRMITKTLDLMKTQNGNKFGSALKAENYWNTNYDDFEFKDGIIDTYQNQRVDLWDRAVKKPKKSPFKTNDPLIRDLKNLITTKPKNPKNPPYKFFIYDEINNKWEKNDAGINLFAVKMKINPNLSDSPLVLFSNSYEKSLIKLNSVLINDVFPTIDDDDDEIFVYALYGKALKSTSTVGLINKISTTKTKNPIYLLLHVPTSKKELTNLNLIIYQIHFFLSIICDIEIVLLDREYFKDQIYLLDKFSSIKAAYKESVENLANMLQNSYIMSYTSLTLDYGNENLSSDGDENEDDEKDEENEILRKIGKFKEIEKLKKDDEDDNDDYLNDIFARVDSKLYKRVQNYIILVDTDKIKGCCKRTDTSNFFNELHKSIKNDDNNNINFKFINHKDSSTYYDFLTTLHKHVFKCNLYTNEESFDKLDFIEMANISGYYIQYKLGIKSINPLHEMIFKRFIQFKDFNIEGKSDLRLLSQLNKELIKTYPSIDNEYNKKCNAAISAIRDEKTKKHGNEIKKELGISAQNSVDYWDQKINEQDYWPVENRNNVKKLHDNFLKSEFFDIIENFFQKNELSINFANNYPILEEQIKKDVTKFNAIFDKLDEEIISKNYQKHEGFDDLRDKGTNYMIRERQSVRQIKAIVEAGQLESVIEQDF